MKHRKRHKDRKNGCRTVSIKWKVFVSFLVFAALLLVMLWLLQIVYLYRFYKQVKKGELKSAISRLIAYSGEEEYEQIVEAVARKYNLSVLVFDGKGQTLYCAESMPARFRYAAEFRYWYERAKENGGEYRKEMRIEDSLPRLEGLDRFSFKKDMAKPRRTEEVMAWVKVVSMVGGERVYILEAVLTPVDATVHTLRIQLLFVSIIMVVLSFGIAWILARGISLPVIRVNQSAKELAKANYQAVFDAGGYKEIEELSETLNYAASELGKTERFQKELLANVSHDLRTPLTLIIACGEMMRDLPGENTEENLQVIIDEANHLSLLVSDMLDLSKLYAGVLTLSKREFCLTDTIYQTVERLTRLLKAQGYQIIFLYQEQVKVFADDEKLCQVLYNLIGNAVNYSGEEKCVTVRQCCVDGRVRIEISDTGEGIPQEELSHIWERYYKVDRYHKRVITGTGLGLSIVKNILQLHGARFGAESQMGQGSMFWFELDAKE